MGTTIEQRVKKAGLKRKIDKLDWIEGWCSTIKQMSRGENTGGVNIQYKGCGGWVPLLLLVLLRLWMTSVALQLHSKVSGLEGGLLHY